MKIKILRWTDNINSWFLDKRLYQAERWKERR